MNLQPQKSRLRFTLRTLAVILCANGDVKTMFNLILLLAVGMTLAAAQEPSEEVLKSKNDGELGGLSVQDGWQAHPGNPCIRFGEHRLLGAWNDPCVIKDGGKYVMYLTSSRFLPGLPPVQPYRAVSENGVEWQLEPKTALLNSSSDPSDFDYQSVETPSVVVFQNRYHMYYTGVQKGLGGPMAIGHAISSDGVHWSKDPANPVLRPTGDSQDFNGIQVAEPGAVVYKDLLYLYFTSVGRRPGGQPPARRVIGLVKSVDGSEFGAPQVVLEQESPYLPQLGFDGYSTPAAMVRGGRVHLFYDVGYFRPDAERKWTQVAIHHADSENGETNWRQDSQAVFTRQSFPWASMEVRSPSPLLEGDTLHLWFAGNAEVEDFLSEVKQTTRTDQFGIGYARTSADRWDESQATSAQRSP